MPRPPSCDILEGRGKGGRRSPLLRNPNTNGQFSRTLGKLPSQGKKETQLLRFPACACVDVLHRAPAVLVKNDQRDRCERRISQDYIVNPKWREGSRRRTAGTGIARKTSLYLNNSSGGGYFGMKDDFDCERRSNPCMYKQTILHRTTSTLRLHWISCLTNGGFPIPAIMSWACLRPLFPQ